ncbi:hypothetical protein HZA87_00230 [Candidatus Uhrbacteria bacterium]|nr:hypothetical protein [Candidatus Uhrbacteria bacterium]
MQLHWPDPWKPVYVVRDFMLLRDGEDPLPVLQMRLVELIAGCLYEIPARQGDERLDRFRELRPGKLLSRNLNVTRRKNGEDAQKDPARQCFISYDGVYKARRGLGRADRRAKGIEIPDLTRWDGTFDALMRTSWRLRRAEDGEQAEFVLVAVGAAKKREHVLDEDKRRALGRTLQTVSLKDRPECIPLVCFAGHNRLIARIQAVRGIGRRMSLREIVLEHYLDRLREICREVSFSQEYRLRKMWLAPGPKRTPKAVRQEAQRLEDAARRLRLIVTRPFSRSFARVADDMDEAARILREAANGRNGDTIDRAREVIGRIYRSMKQLECHWQLEELMLQAAVIQDRDDRPSDSQQDFWHGELRYVHRRLTSVDRLTGKRLEDGFARPVLPHVVPHVHLADVHLMRQTSDGGPDLPRMYEEMRTACDPL